MSEQHFSAHGKLLLTGEYAVLDGALALALPTQKGQLMTVTPSPKKGIHFRSLTLEGEVWFEATLFTGSTDPIAQTLERILSEAKKLRPSFLETPLGTEVETRLEFPRYWGLGSSSTLIAMIAQWAGVDPYTLLWNSFGGSGYDIACATASSPLLYQLHEGQPKAYPVYYNPSFASSLFFVYLNKKQNSREGIALYRKREKHKKTLIAEVSALTEEVYRTSSFTSFCTLLDNHESLLSSFLQLPTVKTLLFPDFSGTLKSLGAWGGDFILATGEADYVSHYFKERGFYTVIPFREMILIKDKEPILPPARQEPL